MSKQTRVFCIHLSVRCIKYVYCIEFFQLRGSYDMAEVSHLLADYLSIERCRVCQTAEYELVRCLLWSMVQLEENIMVGMVEGRRGRGRPRTRWLDEIKRETGMSLGALCRAAEHLREENGEQLAGGSPKVWLVLVAHDMALSSWLLCRAHNRHMTVHSDWEKNISIYTCARRF